MWSCPCCLRFKLTPDELEQRNKSQEIDKMIEKDRQQLKRQVKLLLLGAGESGKSTFLKQMRIIHGIKFENDLLKEYQQVIYQNVIKGMRVLVDARDKLGIPWGDNSNAELGRKLLEFNNTVYLDSSIFMQYTPLVSKLWLDIGIRRAFERRREFQLVSIIIVYFRSPPVKTKHKQNSLQFYCRVTLTSNVLILLNVPDINVNKRKCLLTGLTNFCQHYVVIFSICLK